MTNHRWLRINIFTVPKEKAAFVLKMNVDERGNFTELVHTHNAGQVSINISKPGLPKDSTGIIRSLSSSLW